MFEQELDKEVKVGIKEIIPLSATSFPPFCIPQAIKTLIPHPTNHMLDP